MLRTQFRLAVVHFMSSELGGLGEGGAASGRRVAQLAPILDQGDARKLLLAPPPELEPRASLLAPIFSALREGRGL